MIDRLAKRYGLPPSRWLGVEDEWLAVGLDMTCGFAGLSQEADHLRQVKTAFPVVVVAGG